MEYKKQHIIGIIAAVLIIAFDIILLSGSKIFYFILGIGSIIGAFPFIFSLVIESQKENENNEMFLEFSRDLVEGVKAGTPISRSILNLKGKYYGSLTGNIQKLANQISIGINVRKALEIFASDVDSVMVKRAITLISDAEKAGGNIEDVLDSVAKSVNETEKLKKERRAAIYSLVVQGYIIFFVFIVIMVVMEIQIIPMTAGISVSGTSFNAVSSGTQTSGSGFDPSQFTFAFLGLLITQGFFAGLVIGKLSEGEVKSGLKHSFIMVAMAILISTGSKLVLQ